MRSNNKAAQVYWCYRQILKMADGKEVDPKLGLFRAFLDHFRDDAANSKKYKNPNNNKEIKPICTLVNFIYNNTYKIFILLYPFLFYCINFRWIYKVTSAMSW